MALCALGLALLCIPASAQAAPITVDSNADNTTGCTLRNAITAANTNTAQGTCAAGSGPSDTIDFSLPNPSTITLTSTLPTISGDTTITGPGQSQLTLDGAGAFQVLRMGTSTATVSISGLTITHGECAVGCAGGTGGGLFNGTNGTVHLSDLAITDNDTFGQGGGIYSTGTMTLTNVLVNANTSAETGPADTFSQAGGIFNDGNLTLTQSTVSGNTASGTGATNQNAPQGGGIFNNSSGLITIDRSTIASNAVTADAQGGASTNASGGAIINTGTLNITRSTISNNTATGINGASSNNAVGAGISNGGSAVVTIDRSTLSDNTATVTAPDISQGGAMSVSGATFTITSSTLAHNSAGLGAGLALQHAITLKNTIISNPGGGGTDCSGGSFTTSQGYNLADDASCELADATDQENTDPMLAASLANNGGPTRTYALLDGSPAIDKGKSSAGENIDQRGLTRPSDFGNILNAPGGDGTDIGAFELQDTTPPNTVIDTGPGGATNDPTPKFTFHSTEAGSSFQCKIDAHAFAACNSPRTLAHLADGSHTFQVRAKDLAGNQDASPAMRSFTVKTASVSRSGSTLVVTAAPPAKDNLKVTQPSPTMLRVTDLPAGAFTGSGIHVGAGCTRSGDYTANCKAGPITAIKVTSGAATDRLRNSTDVPSSLNGGAANDALIGGTANDTLNGGKGVDTFQGGKGNDMLLARDNTSDGVIDCDGPGGSPGTADKATVDALPKDPNPIIHGCETVTRP